MIPREQELDEFCRLNTDRLHYLEKWLNEKSIPFRILETGPFKHLLITPGNKRGYSSRGRKKVLIAHYDRVPGTPGANDNSASVFQLLYLAVELERKKQQHNCLIILSDGEELEGERSLKEQGAYRLGEILKDYQFDKSLLVVLDLCGRGDTLIYCSSYSRAMGGLSYDSGLPVSVENLIRQFSRGESFSQEKYFSDDLGLIAHSFPTLLLSLLPWNERHYLEEGTIPPSWANQHTQEDLPETLESRAFRTMGSFLIKLSALQV